MSKPVSPMNGFDDAIKSGLLPPHLAKHFPRDFLIAIVEKHGGNMRISVDRIDAVGDIVMTMQVVEHKGKACFELKTKRTPPASTRPS